MGTVGLASGRWGFTVARERDSLQSIAVATVQRTSKRERGAMIASLAPCVVLVLEYAH